MPVNRNVGVPCEEERYLTKIQQFARDIDRLVTLAMVTNETEKKEIIGIIEQLIQQFAHHIKPNKVREYTPQRHKDPSLIM